MLQGLNKKREDLLEFTRSISSKKLMTAPDKWRSIAMGGTGSSWTTSWFGFSNLLAAMES